LISKSGKGFSKQWSDVFDEGINFNQDAQPFVWDEVGYLRTYA
jgi:hypothetical protein